MSDLVKSTLARYRGIGLIVQPVIVWEHGLKFEGVQARPNETANGISLAIEENREIAILRVNEAGFCFKALQRHGVCLDGVPYFRTDQAFYYLFNKTGFIFLADHARVYCRQISFFAQSGKFLLPPTPGVRWIVSPFETLPPVLSGRLLKTLLQKNRKIKRRKVSAREFRKMIRENDHE